MFGGGGLVLERGDVRVDLGAVFFLGVFGRNFDGVFGFHVDQQHGSFSFGRISCGSRTWNRIRSLPRIAQRLDGVDHDFGLFVEIGDHHHDAAPPQELLKMDERLGEIGARAELARSRWRAPRA